METANFKIYLILSFLIIVIPGEHISPPVGLTLLFSLFQSIWSIFYENLNQESLIEYATIAIVCNSLFLIIIKNKLLNLTGIIIQFIWLLHIFKYKFLKDWFYTVPALLYLVLSLIFVYLILTKRETKIR